ncbi:MAG: FMN-binding protein, partial [Fulvivirga sp.]|nr:FMN-binding protein [Fulvivirga sp.]
MNGEIAIKSSSGSFKMLRAMVGIGIICGFLIVFTYEGTMPRIQQLKQEALQKAIFEVIPGATQMQPYAYVNNAFEPADEGAKNVVYVGFDEQ